MLACLGRVRSEGNFGSAGNVADVARSVIRASKPQPRIVRYELTEYEWAAIKPMLPNKALGVLVWMIVVSKTAFLGAVILPVICAMMRAAYA
jgi:hypothetical protein